MRDTTDIGHRYASAVVAHNRLVIVCIILGTVLVGGGILFLDGGVEFEPFEVETAETEAMQFADDNFVSTESPITIIVVHDERSLERNTLLRTLEVQDAIRRNETIRPTLADDGSTVGIANAISFVSNPDITPGGADLDAEIEELGTLSEDEIREELSFAVALDDMLAMDRPGASTLLSRDYEPGTAHDPSAHLVVVIHDETVDESELLAAQEAIDRIARDELADIDAFTTGEPLVTEQATAAIGANFMVVGPLALLLVISLLWLSYRRIGDVAYSILGIGIVLIWLLGFLGWTGMGLNQLLVAVPCLLIGLSIDHGLHILMRYRAAAVESPQPWARMRTGVAGVIVAIFITTLTTIVGFLSGVVSPIGLIRQFGLASAFGIGAAFVVFGAFIPALKVELAADDGGESGAQSWQPVGLEPLYGPFVTTIVAPATRHVLPVIVIATIAAAAGIGGLAAVDTSTDRADFLPGEQPSWMDALPTALEPDAEPLRERAILVDESFDAQSDPTVHIVLTERITERQLESMQAAERRAIAASSLSETLHGRPVIYTPIDALDTAAAENETVASALESADTTGDGIPDSDVDAVLSKAYDSHPETVGQVLHRNDSGEFTAARIVIRVDDSANYSLLRWEMEEVASELAASDDADVVVTGDPIVEPQQEWAVSITLLGSFAVTLLVIGSLLTVLYRRRHGSWTLGPITVLPVLYALAWTVGLMALFSIPFTAETAIITGIAIGLGVDYTIHITERFMQRRRIESAEVAVSSAVSETGSVIFATALTTAAGFAALLAMTIPSLQRFGLLSAVVILFACLASLVLLPILLLMWSE